jgi:hypothetical protein
MSTPRTNEQSGSLGRIALYLVATFVLLPFIYLTSLSVLHSAYAHGYPIPSRAFLGAYAAPSNLLADTPVVGGLYSSYYAFCARFTKADYDPNKKQ